MMSPRAENIGKDYGHVSAIVVNAFDEPYAYATLAFLPGDTFDPNLVAAFHETIPSLGNPVRDLRATTIQVRRLSFNQALSESRKPRQFTSEVAIGNAGAKDASVRTVSVRIRPRCE